MYLLYTALNPASQIQVRLCQKLKIKIQHSSTKMPSNGAARCAGSRTWIEATDRPEILVAESLGIMQKSDIILSRKRLSYLDELCDAKGIVGEPVIFQTKDDRDKKKASILGDGSHDIEKALYWTLGGTSCSSLASITFNEPESPKLTYCLFRNSGPNDR